MFSGAYVSDRLAKQALHVTPYLSQVAAAGRAKAACLLSWLGRWWRQQSLSVQFIIAATAVLVSAMALLGAWISARIEDRVVQNTAISTAFYMDSLIEPLLQPLAAAKTLEPNVQAELDKLLKTTALGKTIANIKVWNLDGMVVYSTNREIIGKSFPNTHGFVEARAGRIEAEFDDVVEAENYAERRLNRPLLEVYAPIHEYGTNRVIGVSELYQYGDGLRADIAGTRWTTFMVVGTFTLGMLGLLYTIVKSGNHTIVSQQAALEGQITKLSLLLEQNEGLNRSIVAARKMTTETNERLLRRVGADLHDGPAQLMGLSLLYFDFLNPSQHGVAAAPAVCERFEMVRGLLQDALSDVRNISADIAPPHLERLSAVQTIELAIRNHEKRTGTAVVNEVGPIAAELPINLKTCLYRFVQEGLNNAFRHAKGSETTVGASLQRGKLTVEVADTGPGFTPDGTLPPTGLGLAGLRDRVEACDGTLDVGSKPGEGTRLVATFSADTTTFQGAQTS